MSANSKTGKATDASKTDDKSLDDAIDDTFPASDPVAPATGGRNKPKSREDDTEKELDDALEDTFPASDPLPLTDPDQPKS